MAERDRGEGGGGPRGLRLIRGEGPRPAEALGSRDAVARVLLEAGTDLLLKRISSDRAAEITRQVDEVLALFDRVDAQPLLALVLERKLETLESLMRDTRETRVRRPALRTQQA